MNTYRFIDQGIYDGEPYVDVVDADGGDPMEYGIRLEDARARYGDWPILAHPGMLS